MIEMIICLFLDELLLHIISKINKYLHLIANYFLFFLDVRGRKWGGILGIFFFGVCVVWDLMLSSLDNFDTLNST